MKRIAVTSSKQWIHFLLSVFWPPTSISLNKPKGKCSYPNKCNTCLTYYSPHHFISVLEGDFMYANGDHTTMENVLVRGIIISGSEASNVAQKTWKQNDMRLLRYKRSGNKRTVRRCRQERIHCASQRPLVTFHISTVVCRPLTFQLQHRPCVRLSGWTDQKFPANCNWCRSEQLGQSVNTLSWSAIFKLICQMPLISCWRQVMIFAYTR